VRLGRNIARRLEWAPFLEGIPVMRMKAIETAFRLRRAGPRRMRPTLRSLWLALLLALGLALPAAARDQLVIGMTQYPSTLHPSIDAMLAKSYLQGLTRRPFTVYDADWKLVCLLCTELPTFENGKAVRETLPDGREGVAVTYSIQPKATWGDGTPVTTEDVLFTYEAGRNAATGISNAELYRRILKIDVIDEKRFTMHLDRIEFTYNGLGDFNILPAHLEREALEDPANYRTRTRYDSDPTNPGLYFGPYRITGITPGAEIRLEANPTWWGKPPPVKRIILKVIENTAALEANLLSGSIDYIAGELGLSIDQALAFEKRHGADYDFLYKAGLFYEHIALNLDHPILQSRAVRQALLAAIDRDAINAQLFGGKQAIADTSVSPLDAGYEKATHRYGYDPAAAAALLDGAGWTLGGDGIRRNAAGDKLSLELVTTAGDRNRELVQQVLQAQWREIGVETRLRSEPARILFGETLPQRKFEMGLFAFLSSPENVPRTTLHSTMIPTAENGGDGQNYTGFSSAEMDELLDRLEVELDPARRLELWRRLQEIYASELPVLPLWFRAQPFIMPKWLTGIVPTGNQFPTTLWVEDWKVE
jgi:peptide/nickel transport system substrate-binding protein